LARSVVQLGLGSPLTWKRAKGPAQFSKTAINHWLDEHGAQGLPNHVNIDCAILDELEGNWPKEKGHFFILLETNDGAGYMELGKAIESLEAVHVGLGASFYVVLMDTMWHWMYAYDITAADYFYDHWRESIEMEIEFDESDSAEKKSHSSDSAAFVAYCEANGIDFPDLSQATPACLRDLIFRQERRPAALRRHLALLTAHRSGQFADLIEPVIAMAAVRKHGKTRLSPTDAYDIWDDQPLPNWIVAFEKNDPIVQAFDEEARSMNESSHAPCWIETFDPADHKDVHRVLKHVKDFLTVNLQMVKVAAAAANLTKKGQSNAGTGAHQFDAKLRAA